MHKRVVITGIGPVTSVGIGVEKFFEEIWAGRPRITTIPASFVRGYALHSGFYVPLPEVSLREHDLEVAQENLMQPGDRMVVLAAKLALEDAGLRCMNHDGRVSLDGLDSVSLTLGTGLASMQTALESYLSHSLGKETPQDAPSGRKPLFSRMVVPRTMPDSPAAWASIVFGLTGSCLTLNASCASGTCAVGEAFQRVRSGVAPLALAGGVESLLDPGGFMMRGFDVLGVLTRSPDGRPMPFSKNRSGFLFAEGGACLLVLEELEHAQSRGARVYAEVARYGANSDAYSIMQIDPGARQIRTLLAELAAGQQVEYMNAHGTGTTQNDLIEAQVIQGLFGRKDEQPLINSTKGILGHTLGASGAIEAAVTALSIARGSVHGNLTSEPLDDLNLPLESRSCRIDRALTVSYGFGGHNAGLLLTRVEATE